jgi:enoyl-CoA hydratase/carnithine racemase
VSLVEVRDEGAVRWIGLNRPDKRNAIDQAMADELAAAFDDARGQPCVLVLHSVTPGMFAAGADIAELRDRDADAALLAINAGLFERLEAHRWPTVAAVDGPALGGGCELALACDFRTASERAYFAQPELSLGILAGAGANWRLAQAVGQQTARRMLYTGARLTAADARAAGLVDELAGDPEAAARALAGKIARQSWRALELTKLALRSQRPATTTFDLAAQALLFGSQDKYDRMTAFLNRPKALAVLGVSGTRRPGPFRLAAGGGRDPEEVGRHVDGGAGHRRQVDRVARPGVYGGAAAQHHLRVEDVVAALGHPDRADRGPRRRHQRRHELVGQRPGEREVLQAEGQRVRLGIADADPQLPRVALGRRGEQDEEPLAPLRAVLGSLDYPGNGHRHQFRHAGRLPGRLPPSG